LKDKLLTYAKNNLNVMIIGSHGIGKTTIVNEVASELGLNFCYYSTSTLDPWADIVGIPTPDKENNCLNFYKPKKLQEAEFLMFDEINRAHSRVLNSILEIVQFKTVNAEPLPKLKMVWCCMNPPEDEYQVEQLDPALIDRFHVYVKMKAEINIEYLSKFINLDVAIMLKDWWDTVLDKEQKRILTPRRIEYLGRLISKDIPWTDCIPQGHTFPVEELSKRIKVLRNEEDYCVITKESVLAHKEKILEKMKEDATLAIPVSNIIKKLSDEELFECRDLLEFLPKELVCNIGAHKFSKLKRLFFNHFAENNIDTNNYPKITEFFETKE